MRNPRRAGDQTTDGARCAGAGSVPGPCRVRASSACPGSPPSRPAAGQPPGAHLAQHFAPAVALPRRGVDDNPRDLGSRVRVVVMVVRGRRGPLGLGLPVLRGLLRSLLLGVAAASLAQRLLAHLAAAGRLVRDSPEEFHPCSCPPTLPPRRGHASGLVALALEPRTSSADLPVSSPTPPVRPGASREALYTRRAAGRGLVTSRGRLCPPAPERAPRVGAAWPRGRRRGPRPGRARGAPRCSARPDLGRAERRAKGGRPVGSPAGTPPRGSLAPADRVAERLSPQKRAPGGVRAAAERRSG